MTAELDDEDQGVGDEPSGVDIVCRDCGSTFEHTGRGRRPVRCPACRSSSSRSRTSSPTVPDEAAPKRSRGIDTLEASIRSQLGLLGMGLMFFDQFDAKIVLSKSEKGAKALANLAQTNPKIRKVLEEAVEMAGWAPVALWAAEMFLPIAAHHNMIRGVADPAKSATPPKNPAATDVPV